MINKPCHIEMCTHLNSLVLFTKIYPLLSNFSILSSSPTFVEEVKYKYNRYLSKNYGHILEQARL